MLACHNFSSVMNYNWYFLGFFPENTVQANACSQESPSAVTYGNSQQRVSRLPNLWWTGPTMTLFDGLFLKCVNIYEFETFT